MTDNLASFRMFTANCTGNAKNSYYRSAVTINNVEDLAAACQKDHVCAAFADCHRSNDDYIRGYAFAADCDNDFTDDPAAWISPATVATQLPGVAFYAVKSRNCDKVKHPGEENEHGPRPRYHYYFPLLVPVEGYKNARQLADNFLNMFPMFDDDGTKPAQFFYGHGEPVAEYHSGTKDIQEYFQEKNIKMEPEPEIEISAEEHSTAVYSDNFASLNVHEMLSHISANCDYGTWYKIGMAIKAAGLPFEIWDDWSKTVPDLYPSVEEMRRKWISFKDGKITFGTLVHMAQENGWQSDPEKLTGKYKANHEAAEQKRKERAEKHRKRVTAALEAAGLSDTEYSESMNVTYNFDGSVMTIEDTDSGEILYTAPDQQQNILPAWIYAVPSRNGVTKKINEPVFCDLFKTEHHLVRVNGIFYYEGHPVSDDFILNEIQKLIQIHFFERVGILTGNVCKTLANACYTEQPEPDERKVYCADYTTLTISDTGEIVQQEEDVFTLTRIPVRYDPAASCPTFEKYLRDIFYEEDIPAIQEFIGYCLAATTRAQAGLFIHGKGGEGKSVLRDVIMRLFGHTVKQEAISNLDKQFVIANLENMLVCIDDDMDTSLMRDTSMLKKIITSKGLQQVERKHLQKHDAYIFARIIGIGNSFIGSMFDQSDGYYRRQLLIDCKPKTREKDDRFMSDKCTAETQGVLNWALQGLCRLVRNGFNFTVSERMQDTLNSIRRENDNVLAFLENNVEDTGNNDDFISSADLFAAYALDCKDNGDMPVKKKTFQTRISEKYRDRKDRRIQHIVASEYSSSSSVDRKVTGYTGLRFIDHVDGFKWMSRLHRQLPYDDENYINRLT